MPSQFIQRSVRVALLFVASLVLLALVVLTAESIPLLLRRAIYLVPLGMVFWIAWGLVASPKQQVRQLLSVGNFSKAYRVASKHALCPLVRDYLNEELDLPNESLRPSLRRAFEELNLLHDSSADEANHFVESGLKRAMRDSSEEALRALWNTCANLEVVARQEVAFADDHPKIQGIISLLDGLEHSTRRARVKLAELSLGSTQGEVEEARVAMETVRRQSEFLLELESVLA
ncbi:MAG: hypothetical protein AB7I98_22065 [Verrucomicrobiales bacterium]